MYSFKPDKIAKFFFWMNLSVEWMIKMKFSFYNEQFEIKFEQKSLKCLVLSDKTTGNKGNKIIQGQIFRWGKAETQKMKYAPFQRAPYFIKVVVISKKISFHKIKKNHKTIK